jgi:glutathione synthase/RimK-type ligase-like ATP-grasp enzyme
MDRIVAALARARERIATGDDEAARAILLEALAAVPGDPRILTDLGTLLFRTGYRSAALTVYGQAVLADPGSAVAHANLASAHFDGSDLAAARTEYEIAIALDPGYPEAHQGLSYVLERLGESERARVHRERGFRGRPIVTAPYRGDGTPLRVLLLVSAAGGNVFTERILNDRYAEITTVVVDFADPAAPLPPHDLVFNAIGDADRVGSALHRALTFAARLRVPVLNHPAHVLATTRGAIAGRLRALPGVIAPRAELVARDGLESALANVRYPVLLRSPGFHTGEHFVRVRSREEALSAAASLPGAALYVIEYVDLREADGTVRKYRMIAVGGVLFPLHLAIARDWKVHYFTADMAEVPEHRDADAAFLADPELAIGAPAMRALEAITRELALDFMGIDFGLDARGNLVVFEANATMNVLPPEADPRWDYRREPVARVFAAFESLLVSRGVRVP